MKVEDRNPTAEDDAKNDQKPTVFEDAIALTGHSRFHYLLLASCGGCLIAMVFEVMNVSFLLPAAQCDFDMTSNQKGLLNSACYIGMICSSHLWGFLADTRGRRKILILTLLLDSACALVCSLAPTYPIYLLLRFLNGFFICGPSAVVFAYLGEFQSARTRSRAIVLVTVVLCLGSIALPSLAWLIIPLPLRVPLPWGGDFRAWRIFVAICGLPSLLAAVVLAAVLPESPKFLLAMGRDAEAMEVLRTVFAKNTGLPPEQYPVHALVMDSNIDSSGRKLRSEEKKGIKAVLSSIHEQTAPLFRSPHLPYTLVACFMQFGLYISFNGLLLWLPEVFNRMADYATTYSGQSATVCEIMAAMADIATNGITTLQEPANGTLDIMTANSSLADDCVVFVNPEVFQNILIISMVSTLLTVSVCYLVNHAEKKILIFISLTSAGVCGGLLYFVNTPLLVFAMACLFVTLSGVCVSLVNTVVIEIFPTHLRAMAVCLSLMMGRVGTVVGSLMMGSLLEVNCGVTFLLLSGVVIFCGSMSCFLPRSRGNKKTTLAP